MRWYINNFYLTSYKHMQRLNYMGCAELEKYYEES